jgi:hypothetical protein
MSRRLQQFGKAKPDVPLWRRRDTSQAGPFTPSLSKRQARKLGREMGRGMAVTLPASQTTPGAAQETAAAATQQDVAQEPRHRFAPNGWALWVAAAGVGAHFSPRPMSFGLIAGAVSAVVLWLFTRHLSPFARRACAAMAALTAVLVPVLAWAGWAAPWPAVLAVAWAAVLAPWARHYRRRPLPPEEPAPDLGDRERWAALAERRRWIAWLTQPREQCREAGEQAGVDRRAVGVAEHLPRDHCRERGQRG